MESIATPLFKDNKMSAKHYFRFCTSKELIKFSLIIIILLILCISGLIAFYDFINPLDPGFYFYDLYIGSSYIVCIEVFRALYIIIFITSFVGLMGTIKNSSHLLKFYSFLLIITTISNIIIGSFLTQSSLQGSTTGYLKFYKFMEVYREDDTATTAIDFTQYKFKCCGFFGPNDWNELPASCFALDMEGTAQFASGCASHILLLLYKTTILVLIVTSPMSLLMISCIVLTSYFLKKLKGKRLTQNLANVSIISRNFTTTQEPNVEKITNVLDDPQNCA